jgi:cysteine desulfurase / selenocysteine lyase
VYQSHKPGPSAANDCIDLEAVRRDTPGVDQVIHLNNAGASLMPRPVVDAVVDHIRLEAEIGGYEAADAARHRVAAVYDSLARLLNCSPSEVAILESATRAWDMAFYSMNFRTGDRILTAESEYSSNYIAFLQVCQRTGASVEVVPNDESGQVSVEALRRMIDDSVKLISMNHVPTQGGLVNPAADIGAVAVEAGVPFMLDACQSLGQMELDVEQLGCDILTAAGRKYLRGPRGTGVMYVSRRLLDRLEPPFLDSFSATWVSTDSYEMRDDARKFECWEANYAAKLGLGAAIDYALALGIPRIQARIDQLASFARGELSRLPRLTLRDLGATKCGVITFTLDGVDHEKVFSHLRTRRINTSVSLAKYSLIDMEKRSLPNVMRVSVHYFNTEEEILQLCREIRNFTCCSDGMAGVAVH